MAYIRKIQRKKGTVYKVEVCLYDGSKKSRVFRTKDEAQQWGRSQEELKRSHRSYGLVQVRMTLNQYFEKWFEEYASLHHSKGWQKSDRQMYETYIKSLIGQRLLVEIQPVDIQRVLREMIHAGLKASYANRVRTMLHKMFNEAVLTYRFLTSNPVTAVRRFKEEPFMASNLNHLEAAKLLVWADLEPHGIALHIALQLGLREGEILGLKWDAVDLETRSLSVRRKWDKKTNVLDEFVKGKKIR
ncbi:hypothetical protein EBZ37_10310, partial [bacterium]|nr:hypothetical protein [bacterium]